MNVIYLIDFKRFIGSFTNIHCLVDVSIEFLGPCNTVLHNISIRPMPISSRSFPILYSSKILSLDATFGVLFIYVNRNRKSLEIAV